MPTPRVVLVTGASSGIGLATAVAAAGAGDHVVLAARGRASLDAAERECKDAGAASTLVVPTDVGDDAAVAALVGAALERHGRLDAVISCAGVVAYGRTEDVPADVFDGVLRTNLHGSVNVARHVVPVLRRQRRGQLLLVGSLIGHIAVPSMTAYVLSKWGVRALVGQLRVENRDLPHVTIGYVAPGGVNTPIYTQAANYAGFIGRPPPPVASPARTARQVMRRLDHPWLPAQLTPANDVIRFGAQYLPFVYARIINPFFPIGATDLTEPTGPTTGNVLASRPDGNALEGDPGHALAGIVKNIRQRLRGRRPR
ncbi:SDR family NAD(P)-dependent oxidoreductase [Nocardioides anomalus]|uniref:SDR family NAD(P)-dependent oxidoreductase n=1 Tax=Nocardioides anomalus TaxID=2712223 RepID=A0A6G6WH99_9ACTN|nr:SDR family NAD(P)-dependent oxidoreductase [Nocardioides anomalus]QIG44465.1 SDR family NAD(P)-dependent oxidoreductase [Nocardioides anomalus]